MQAAFRTFGRLELLIGQTPDRRLRLFLYLRLARFSTTPTGVHERARAFHHFLESVVGDAGTDAVLLAPIPRRLEHLLLNLLEDVLHLFRNRVERHGLLGAIVAAHEHRLILVEIAGTELHPHRDAAQLPIVVLGARLHSVAAVDVYAQAVRFAPLPVVQRLVDALRRRHHATLLVVGPEDRHDHELDRREQRRDTQTLVVAMRHDEPADQPRRDTPAGVPRELDSAGFALELEVEHFREVL